MDCFTAIDFETAQGKRWSICQVGVVRVENGIIVNEIDLLVQPPDNCYFYKNIEIHRITPEGT
jgi:DNA polymerase III subunit epsilon